MNDNQQVGSFHCNLCLKHIKATDGVKNCYLMLKYVLLSRTVYDYFQILNFYISVMLRRQLSGTVLA